MLKGYEYVSGPMSTADWLHIRGLDGLTLCNQDARDWEAKKARPNDKLRRRCAELKWQVETADLRGR